MRSSGRRRLPRNALVLALVTPTTATLSVAHAEPDSRAPVESGSSDQVRLEPEPLPPSDSSPVEPVETERERSWTIPTLHALGIMTTTRLVEAYLYPDPFAETRLRVIGEHYQDAFTMPPKFDASRAPFEWDGDPWTINVIGHGLLGSELYLRARTCGLDPIESLLFTTGGTVVWDYGFEGNGVRPSALDLVYTPAAGLLLGETRYWVWNEARKVESPFWRGALRAFFDPLGELERAAGSPC